MMLDNFRALQLSVTKFERDLLQLRATRVTRSTLLSEGRAIVDVYFRDIRGQLSSTGIAEQDLLTIDGQMQSLLEATHRRTPTATFKRLVKASKSSLLNLEKGLLAAAG